ncbi:unnamed protein product [Phytophthora lilii]|uniref:Unnamed protein product n=1 Tax=Phytophthora lilii TaxID=2077276 RepID=A0A9W6X4T5_9STRA|nr:unnamed protein product [Phytophthora lilii]
MVRRIGLCACCTYVVDAAYHSVDHDYLLALVHEPMINTSRGAGLLESYPLRKTPRSGQDSRKSKSKSVATVMEKSSNKAAAAAKRRLYLWIAYNVVLYAAIVVSGAILFMVMVGMVTVGGGDKNVKDDWIEVNSQILNGVFTWMAITNHPFFIYRLVKTLQVLGISKWNWVAPMDTRVRAARYLSRHFPLVFVDTTAIQDH